MSSNDMVGPGSKFTGHKPHEPTPGRYELWPGSRTARDAGCICPVLDNGHGNVELARDRGGWWQFSDCPVHGPAPAPIPAQPGSEPIR